MNQAIYNLLRHTRHWKCIEGDPSRTSTTVWRTPDGRDILVHCLPYQRKTVDTAHAKTIRREAAGRPIVYIHDSRQVFTQFIHDLDKAPHQRLIQATHQAADGTIVTIGPRIRDEDQWDVVDPATVPRDIPRTMRYTDAVAQYFGAQPGQVLRFTGPSETAGKSARYYRIGQ